MPKFRRLVVEGYPHHVTQRGVRRQRTFFRDCDYRAYIQIAADQLEDLDLNVLAYCLMPNHVHFVVVPRTKGVLSKYFCEVHKRYARRTNALRNWQGHLWQQRFYSVVMDERHTLAAMRYVELNPVRAGLVDYASEWVWSSAGGNLGMQDDRLIDTRATGEIISNWAAYLAEPISIEETDAIRRQTRTGRPEGTDAFISLMEARSGRRIRQRKRGRISRKG